MEEKGNATWLLDDVLFCTILFVVACPVLFYILVVTF